MTDHPPYDEPVPTPPHFTVNCAVCGKRLSTATEPVYPGDVPWTYRCENDRVKEDE